MSYLEILKLLLPIVTALCIGAFCKKTKIVDDHAIEKIKGLLFNIILPALLFNSFLFANYSSKSFIYIFVVYVGMACAFFAAKILRKFFIKDYKDYFPELMTLWEGGTIGITLCSLLFGSFGLEQMAIFDFGCTFFLYSIVLPGLYAKDGKKVTVGKIIKMIFSTKMLDGILLGAIFSFLGAGKLIDSNMVVGTVYHGVMDIIVAPASFLIMFFVGYMIRIEGKMIGHVFFTCIIRLIFTTFSCIISSLILFSIIPFDSKIFIVLMIAYSLPPSYSLLVLTNFGDNKKMQEFYSDLASFSIIFTLIVYTILSIYAMI